MAIQFTSFKGRSSRSGFTLVELSIVLVIIGLLAASIISGRHLVFAARVNSLATGINQIQTVVAQYYAATNSLPGDDMNASGRVSGLADGNGDSKVTWGQAGNGSNATDNESLELWAHLSKSGLYPGNFSSNPGKTATVVADPNTPVTGANIPHTKIAGVGYGINDDYVSSSFNGNMIRIGGGASGMINSAPLLPGDVAKSLDAKIDDGSSSTGTVVATSAAAAAAGTSSTPTTPDSAFDTAKTYSVLTKVSL